MQVSFDIQSARQRFLDLVLSGAMVDATTLVADLIDGGASVEAVLVCILGHTQVEIGRRWQDNRCTIAQEHAATAIVDTLVSELTKATGTIGGGAPVAVVCAEGEWHILAARMASEMLRIYGHDVRFLGGSLPADQLEVHLRRHPPLAVCISCSVASFLPGALRSIESAHRAGIPVIAGGPGFGPDDHAAFRIGADAWSNSAQEAHSVLAGWQVAPPEYLAPVTAETATWASLEMVRPALVDDLLGHLEQQIRPSVADIPRGFLRQLIDDTFAHLGAAVLVDDERLFATYQRWLNQFLVSRPTLAVTAAQVVSAAADSIQGCGLPTFEWGRFLRQPTMGDHLAC